PGVAVADVEHRDARQEIEVLVPVLIPQPHTRAAYELHRQSHERADRVLALERLQLRQRGHQMTSPPVIFVPEPASVNGSSNRECAPRPSFIGASPSPAWIASTKAVFLGRIPTPTQGIAASSSAADTSGIVVTGS